MDSYYLDIARVLVQIAPVVLAGDRFALKGGTAINLFERDMPRLSVDLDLVLRDGGLERREALGCRPARVPAYAGACRARLRSARAATAGSAAGHAVEAREPPQAAGGQPPQARPTGGDPGAKTRGDGVTRRLIESWLSVAALGEESVRERRFEFRHTATVFSMHSELLGACEAAAKARNRSRGARVYDVLHDALAQEKAG
ncbi:MAG: nucleotidyl transferase AbiEii/AbiGii toxin family protein [Burkholderiales bacterium]|nr:nucleotidyl transferase AbiEii/AbiGii toxin family protein [Burkholderiales bacterium]